MLNQRRGFGEYCRIAAEELNKKGLVARFCLVKRAGFLALIEQSLGADHLGVHDIRAELPADEPECSVGKPRHRRQQHSRPPGGEKALLHGVAIGFSVGLGVGVAAGIGDSFGSGVPMFVCGGFFSTTVSSEIYQRELTLINLIL